MAVNLQQFFTAAQTSSDTLLLGRLNPLRGLDSKALQGQTQQVL